MSLALDGELSEIEEASLRAHVGRCTACAAFERDTVALTTELRRRPLERPAVGVTLPRRRSAAVRVLQVSAAAAAVVLAAGLGSLAGSLSSGGTTTATTAPAGVGNRAAGLDPGIVAMLSAQRLPTSRLGSPEAL